MLCLLDTLKPLANLADGDLNQRQTSDSVSIRQE